MLTSLKTSLREVSVNPYRKSEELLSYSTLHETLVCKCVNARDGGGKRKVTHQFFK